MQVIIDLPKNKRLVYSITVFATLVIKAKTLKEAKMKFANDLLRKKD